MCHVKRGTDVESRADIQDLVTSIIMQQKVEFEVNDVYKVVVDDLKTSKFFSGDFQSKKQEEIRCIIDRTLDAFEYSGCITSSKGRYQAIKVL